MAMVIRSFFIDEMVEMQEFIGIFLRNLNMR